MGQKKVTVFSQTLRQKQQWEREALVPSEHFMTVHQPQFSRTVPGTDWFSRPCTEAFKLHGLSNAERSSDSFLRTFKGLVKKGLWNFKAFRISFKHSRGLCANPVMSVLHFPNQNPHKQKAAWCISTPKTSLYPLTHSTTPYTFPPFVPATHNPPSHVKGDLNWRRKLAWDLKM